MKKVNIFWTGGLDSTYRVLELSTMSNVEIHPYYIKIGVRKSTSIELNAVREITDIIRSLPDYKGNLLDLKVYNIWEFNNYQDIHDAQVNQRKSGYGVGWQYSYCADLCRYFNMRAEVCLENEQTCGGHKAIKHECVLCEDEFDYFINKEESPKNNIFTIFENIDFPKSVFNATKQEEIDYIKSIEPAILKKINFCHNPHMGKPCGRCTPCKSYKKLGLIDFNL